MPTTRLPEVAHRKDNAHIIVVLTQQLVLDDVKNGRRSKPRGVNHVTYTRDPEKVLQDVSGKQVDIVVTGQRFFDTELPHHEQKGTFLEASAFSDEALLQRHFRFRQGYPRDGTQLSGAVHLANPHVLVFRYSELPSMDRGSIVGDIPRLASNNRSLVDFIDDDSLAEILSEKAWWKLRGRFPMIKFYDSLEKYHS